MWEAALFYIKPRATCLVPWTLITPEYAPWGMFRFHRIHLETGRVSVDGAEVPGELLFGFGWSGSRRRAEWWPRGKRTWQMPSPTAASCAVAPHRASCVGGPRRGNSLLKKKKSQTPFKIISFWSWRFSKCQRFTHEKTSVRNTSYFPKLRVRSLTENVNPQ